MCATAVTIAAGMFSINCAVSVSVARPQKADIWTYSMWTVPLGGAVLHCV